MDGDVTHRASLVLHRLVVRRSLRSLCREAVTLQAHQIDLADPQEPRIRRSMRRVTRRAPFGLYRDMLVNVRPALIRMTLIADGVPARQRSHLPQRSGAMNVVAVVALDQAFVDAVMVRLGEVGFGGNVAAVAEFGLGAHEEMLRLLGFVRRMTIHAANIIAGMR